MSPPAALKLVSAPIADLKPKSLILSGSGIIPLGFVAEGDGTVIVKWASPLDPDNPNETLTVKNGRQYTCQIDKIISSDVDLLFFFGDSSAASAHLGGGSSSGGGGGGDATAANQTLTLTALDAIYDALALVGLETTNVQIRDAVTNLGDGATLADLAAAFSADVDTQADILAALQASEIDIDAIKSGIDLLVPDLDAVRVAVEAINGKTPASPAQDVTLTNGNQKSIVRGGVKGSTSAADVTSTASGSNHQSLDAILYDGSGNAIFGTAFAPSNNISNPTVGGIASFGMIWRSDTSRWVQARGDESGGMFVQGNQGSGATINQNALPVAGCFGSTLTRIQTDSTGRLAVTSQRIARTAHLNSTTLPAAGAFTSQTPYTVPEGVIGITAWITYTQGASGGTVRLRPQYGNGTETSRSPIEVSSAASGENIQETIGFREFVSPNVAGAISFVLEFEVPAGCTTFVLLAAELGVTATPGTCTIALTAKYGAA